LFGEGVVVRDAAGVVVRKAGRMPEAGPNAPLLMRVVRHPFAVAPGSGRRVVYVEEAPPIERVDPAEERRLATGDRTPGRTRSPAGRRPVPFVFRRGHALPAPDAP
jgi:hypothetical protein